MVELRAWETCGSTDCHVARKCCALNSETFKECLTGYVKAGGPPSSASETQAPQGNAESPSSSDLNATGAITRQPSTSQTGE